MIKFIKANDLSTLRKKLYLVYILNILDIVFTLFLLETEMFIEANTLMQPVVENTFLSLILKVVIVALLVLFLGIRLKDATPHQLKISNYWITGLATLYLLVNISHIVWSIMYLRFNKAP